MSIKQHLTQLVSTGLNKRLQTEDDFSPETFREVLESLRESAIGVHLQEITVNRKGEIIPKVYQRAPNVKAIRLLLELANYFPETYANMLLALARMEKEYASKLAIKDQREFLAAQTEKVKLDAYAYTVGTIEPESVQKVIQRLVQSMIGWMQSISRERMVEFCESDEEYQKLVIQFAQMAHAEQSNAIDNMQEGIIPAIVGGKDDGDE